MRSALQVFTNFELRHCVAAYLTSRNKSLCNKTCNLPELFKSFSIHAASCQRGNMSKKFYYAVRYGRKPGVYSTWDECLVQVSGFSKASYKKFPTYEDAALYADNKVPLETSTTKSKTVTDGTAPAALPPGCFDVRLMPSELQPEPIRKSAKRKKNANAKSNISPGPTYKNQSKNKQTAVSCTTDDPPSKKPCLEDLDIPQGMIHVYTDGACTKNGFKGAKAGIGVYWGPDHPLNVSERLPGRQTNNRAEIQAAVKALQQAKTVGIKELTLYTDSNFLINGITKWIKKWKRNGWKLASGEPVINQTDFEDLDKALVSLSVKWVYVPGHKGIAGNEAADHLAVQGMKKALSQSE